MSDHSVLERGCIVAFYRARIGKIDWRETRPPYSTAIKKGGGTCCVPPPAV
jgi:hypothetical protein